MADPARVDQAQATRVTEATGQRRFLTFRVSGRRYAMPAEEVAEVILVPPVARLPHSPKSLMGLANLRGTVIPLVDPRAMLGQEAFVPGKTARAIVLAGAARIAVAVDAVEQLVLLSAGQIETARPELAAEAGEILLGAFQSGVDQPVTKILDLPAILAAAFSEHRGPPRQPRARVAQAAGKHHGEPAASLGQRLLVSFDVAGQDYALPLDTVREIIPLPHSIAVVPRAEAVLLGVAAWRDTLLPLLSLRGLLGLVSPAAWTGTEKVLVTVVNGAPIGLVADRARALIRADVAAIDLAPAMLAARSGGESRIAAIYRADGGRRLISLLAPELLFREDVMRRIGDATAVAAATTDPIASATAQFVVFRLGSEEFGLPIAAVDEVALVPEQLTRVPKMPKFLEGVINLRGEVLPVVDQRRRFDMPAFSGSGRRRLIVVRTDSHRAGLIVDSVSEVLRAPAEAIETPPDLTGEGARLVNGVINTPLNGRMILLLDPGELLTQAEHGVLDELDLADGSRAA
jgi:purine-binding chemotaxis protein CheW